MRLQLGDLAVDEPVDRLKARDIAAVVYSEEEDWCLGLAPHACRAAAKRLLELAAEHEKEHGRMPQ